LNSGGQIVQIGSSEVTENRKVQKKYNMEFIASKFSADENSSKEECKL